MKKKSGNKLGNLLRNTKFWLLVSVSYLFIVLFFIFPDFFHIGNISYSVGEGITFGEEEKLPKYPPLDHDDYDRRIIELANNPRPKVVATSTASSTALSASSTKPTLWPVKTAYPNDGAILPFKRVVAYYGNLYSKGMGVLGQYPEAEMLAKLQVEVDKWTLADPNTPAIPALHYIAVTAQGRAGEDGKWRARMPYTEIDKVITMAQKINGLVFLDIQVGQSTIQDELPLLEKYLKMPQVHVGIDPEFSMKNGRIPGKVVGMYDAADINYVIDYLAKITKENNLPPKILVVHRYIQEMVTNYKLIETLPEVQVVMDMDGWGPRSNKLASYFEYIYKEPVQFTGFKLFYKNDITTGTSIMTPEEILKLNPRPIYIQFQ